MSRESLQKFIQHLSENKEAVDKIKEFGGDMAALSAYAKELGYDVDPQEIEDYRQKVASIYQAKIEKKLKSSSHSATPGVDALRQLALLGETDKAVEAKLAQLGAGEPEGLIAYGREKGFIFDKNDMELFAKEILDSSDELSDEELELAAGGTTVGFALLLGVGLFLSVFGMAVAFAVAQDI